MGRQESHPLYGYALSPKTEIPTGEVPADGCTGCQYGVLSVGLYGFHAAIPSAYLHEHLRGKEPAVVAIYSRHAAVAALLRRRNYSERDSHERTAIIFPPSTACVGVGCHSHPYTAVGTWKRTKEAGGFLCQTENCTACQGSVGW